MPDSNLDDYTLANRKLVMYPDLSVTGRLFGGALLSWIDESSALLAMDHMGTKNIVTKKISEVIFEAPALLGDVLEIWCTVTKEGRSSLSLDCMIVVDHPGDSDKTTVCNCSMTFVAIDSNGKPCAWNNNS